MNIDIKELMELTKEAKAINGEELERKRQQAAEERKQAEDKKAEEEIRLILGLVPFIVREEALKGNNSAIVAKMTRDYFLSTEYAPGTFKPGGLSLKARRIFGYLEKQGLQPEIEFNEYGDFIRVNW